MMVVVTLKAPNSEGMPPHLRTVLRAWRLYSLIPQALCQAHDGPRHEMLEQAQHGFPVRGQKKRPWS